MDYAAARAKLGPRCHHLVQNPWQGAQSLAISLASVARLLYGACDIKPTLTRTCESVFRGAIS